jgi:hypothetical protein
MTSKGIQLTRASIQLKNNQKMQRQQKKQHQLRKTYQNPATPLKKH